MLPLTDHGINRVVVERVAFDILSGPFKARQKYSEKNAAELYWNGPKAGFESRQAMLEEEFGGRCAYCGEQKTTKETEHILPRSRFPFDSYLNVVPACRACNARKQARAPPAANLVIHDEAYEAYCGYLRKRRVLHPYHTIKKGILNLLRRPSTAHRGQQMVAMIADNLVSITNTQRSPRPLARYLATRLEKSQGNRPDIKFTAGRHTALYRWVLMPEYEKEEAKVKGDLRNHAIDAILLGCELPSASALENRNWSKSVTDIEKWVEKVRPASPEMIDGLPRVEPVEFIKYFENDAGGGYCTIDLSAFNWNRERKAAHTLDPFGMTSSGIPVKRVPAQDVLAALKKGPLEREKRISVIAHQTLRRRLSQKPEQAAEEFVLWLQQTTEAGLSNGAMSEHPADQERRRMLQDFVNASVSDVLSDESDLSIPQIIGVRCLNRASGANIPRSINGNEAAQYYKPNAVTREIYVCYRTNNDQQLDREKPIVLRVGQTGKVTRRKGSGWEAIDLPGDNPLLGRPLGADGDVDDFRKRWQGAFTKLCAEMEIVKQFKLTQGCVVEKTDGTMFQIRNFKTGEPWMKNGPFKNIFRVHRSPLFGAERISIKSTAIYQQTTPRTTTQLKTLPLAPCSVLGGAPGRSG